MLKIQKMVKTQRTRSRVNTPAKENIEIDKLRERSGISRNVEFAIEITEHRPMIFPSPWSLCDGTRLKEATHSGGFRSRPRHRFLTHAGR